MAGVVDGVNLKLAARARLDNLGNVKSHSCFVNDLERLNCMSQQTRLALSVVMTDEIQMLEIRNKVEVEE